MDLDYDKYKEAKKLIAGGAAGGIAIGQTLNPGLTPWGRFIAFIVCWPVATLILAWMLDVE